MKIIVTGACGFIGSHLAKKLISKGNKVIGIDDLSKGNMENIKGISANKNFTFKKADITKKHSLDFAKSADVIVHLAAAKIPRYGDRLLTLSVNTKGTENVLELARECKAKVIFSSTSDVYGKNPKLPFSEESDLVLGSPEVARWAYAVSKIFDEHLCFAYWEKYQIPFVILRLFGVYGPQQHRSWWGGPQSLFIDKLLKGESVEIHGDGKQTRTFVYIDDVIDAVLKSINSKKANNQIINIGTKDEISILELAKLISKLTTKPLKIKNLPYKSFTGKKYEDVKRRIPDIKKAKIKLGWQPKFSLEDGLKKTIEWQFEDQ